MNPVPSREGRGWPAYILGGRLRTSTLALLVAFCAIWWLHQTYQPPPQPPAQVPASEVVPPGFIPDPNYTWAPRTDVQPQSPVTTTSEEPTPAPTTTPVSPTPASSAAASPTPASSAAASPTPAGPTTSMPTTAPTTSGAPASPPAERSRPPGGPTGAVSGTPEAAAPAAPAR